MNEATQRWLPVPGWEGLYEVSSQKLIRSLDRTVACRGNGQRRIPGRVLQQWANTAGHPAVTLSRAGMKENWQVDLLVQEVFNPPAADPAYEFEHWLPAPEFESWYDVSDFGRVRSWHPPHGAKGRRKRPLLLTPVAQGTGGYLMVTLRQDGKANKVYVHALVLTAFDRPRRPGEEARHGRAGRRVNALTNLCWGTMHENHQDRVRDDAVVWGERHGNAKLTATQVLECRERRAAEELLADLALEFDMSPSGLSQAVNGVTWARL